MSDLPAPDELLLARSQRLLARLGDTIARDGSLAFSAYMQQALYAPRLGYYVGGQRKFGERGDFVTAPELSPLFARCIARQAQQVLHYLGGGDLLEFGAGTGVLAADMLRTLDALDCLPAHYAILEVSPSLRQLQRDTLLAAVPHLLERVVWLDTWPVRFSGFAIGNEVLDAMPVERFRWRAGNLEQARVVMRSGQLGEVFAPAPTALTAALEHIRAQCGSAWPDGFTSELNTLLSPWFKGFQQAAESAVLLLIDYGYPRAAYYHPMRVQGTLRCHYQQYAHDDPYRYPGLQDITAHVDFTAVAEAGVQAGLALEGFTSQRQFLFNCGLADWFKANMAEADERQRLSLSQQVQQLTLPGQMGESFSAIGFSKNLPADGLGQLRGFAGGDHAHRL